MREKLLMNKGLRNILDAPIQQVICYRLDHHQTYADHGKGHEDTAKLIRLHRSAKHSAYMNECNGGHDDRAQTAARTGANI